MKTLIACAVVLFVMAGCSKPAVETTKTDNPQIKVETLFAKDGCTIYRFDDGGNRYFARCENGQAKTEWNTSCGKSCTRSVQIPTN